MKWTKVLLAALLLCLAADVRAAARPAEAPAVTAARSLVALEMSVLTARYFDEAAFGKLLAPDAFGFFGVGSVASTREELAHAVTDAWFEVQCGPDRPRATHIEAGALGDSAAWVTFDIEYEQSECIVDSNKSFHITARVTQLLRKDAASGQWLVQALQYSEPSSDSKAVKAALAGQVREPAALPAINGDVRGALVQALSQPAALADALADAPAVTLIGSAGKERAVGGKAVRKLLKSWKSVSFERVGGVREWSQKDCCTYVAANVKATFKTKTGDATLYYHVLLIARPDGAVVSVHYGAAQYY